MYRAMVDRRPFEDFARLYVIKDAGPREIEALRFDGAWKRLPEGSSVGSDPEVGLPLPGEALKAIRDALDRELGEASRPSAAEVRVLREWLAMESARVARVLEAR